MILLFPYTVRDSKRLTVLITCKGKVDMAKFA